MSTTRVTRVQLQADVSNLVRGFQVAARQTGSLERDVSSLERELERLSKVNARPNITLGDSDAKARIDEIQQRLADLGHKTADAKVSVNDPGVQAKLSRIEAQLLSVGNQAAEPTIDLRGIAEAEVKLGALQAELNHIDGQTATAHVKVDGTTTAASSMGLLASSIITLGPAAVAAGAVAGGALLGIGSAAGTALGALGPLGLAVTGTVNAMKKQQTSITSYTATLAHLTPGTAAYTAEVTKLNGAQQSFNQQFGVAATALARYKTVWAGFLADTGSNSGVHQVIADALNLASSMLPKLEGVVKAAAGSVSALLAGLSKFANGPEAGAMLAFFQREGPAAIAAFGSVLGNVGKGLVSLFMAFTPMAHGMMAGLQGIAKGFADWAANLPDTQGFKDFMAYVDRVGPKVWATLGSLATAFIAIGTAAGPVGEVTLPLIKALADALTVIARSPAGPALVGAAVALAAINKALAVGAAIGGSSVVKGLSSIGSEAQIAGLKAKAAQAGFVAAGLGLLTLSSNAGEVSHSLGVATQAAGGAALGFSVGGPPGAALGGGVALVSAYGSSLGDLSSTLDGLRSAATSDPFDFAAISKAAQEAAASLNDSGDAANRWAGYVQVIPVVGTYASTALSHFSSSASDAAVSAGILGAQSITLRDNFALFAHDFLNVPLDAPFRDLNVAMKDVIPKLTDLGFTIPRIVKLLGTSAGQKILADALKAAGRAADGTAGSVDHLSAAEKRAAQATKALTNALKADQGVLAHRQAMRDYADAIAAADKAQKHGNTSIRESNVLLDAQASQAIVTAGTMKKGGEQQNAYLEKARTSLYQQALQFGLTETAARKYVDSVLNIPDSAKTKADIDTIAAMAQIKTLQEQYGLTPAQVKTAVSAPGATTAAAQVKALRDYIAQLKSKTVTVTVNTQIGGSNLGGHNIYSPADGMVLDFMAQGGVRRENHVAQIARAGDYRVWAETETGGEAYIPLAPSKRPRSRDITDVVAARLGGSVTWNADGGYRDVRRAGATDPALISEVRGLRTEVGGLRTEIGHLRGTTTNNNFDIHAQDMNGILVDAQRRSRHASVGGFTAARAQS
jgi:hypothetical protein